MLILVHVLYASGRFEYHAAADLVKEVQFEEVEGLCYYLKRKNFVTDKIVIPARQYVHLWFWVMLVLSVPEAFLYVYFRGC
jgi:hypothetical protein